MAISARPLRFGYWRGTHCSDGPILEPALGLHASLVGTARYGLDDCKVAALHLAEAAPSWSSADHCALADFLRGMAKALAVDAEQCNRDEAKQCIVRIQQGMRGAAKAAEGGVDAAVT